MTLRRVFLASLAMLSLAACDEQINLGGEGTYPSRNVTVYSRTWDVRQISEDPVQYRATRDFNNFNPYGPPARLRSTQATAAIQQATGCKVIRSSMYQNISGQFVSQVSCPTPPAPAPVSGS